MSSVRMPLHAVAVVAMLAVGGFSAGHADEVPNYMEQYTREAALPGGGLRVRVSQAIAVGPEQALLGGDAGSDIAGKLLLGREGLDDEGQRAVLWRDVLSDVVAQPLSRANRATANGFADVLKATKVAGYADKAGDLARAIERGDFKHNSLARYLRQIGWPAPASKVFFHGTMAVKAVGVIGDLLESGRTVSDMDAELVLLQALHEDRARERLALVTQAVRGSDVEADPACRTALRAMEADLAAGPARMAQFARAVCDHKEEIALNAAALAALAESLPSFVTPWLAAYEGRSEVGKAHDSVQRSILTATLAYRLCLYQTDPGSAERSARNELCAYAQAQHFAEIDDGLDTTPGWLTGVLQGIVTPPSTVGDTRAKVRRLRDEMLDRAATWEKRPPQRDGCGAASAPTSTVLAMDASQSMGDAGKLEAARDAADQLLEFIGMLNSVGARHSVGLVVFDNLTRDSVPPTVDVQPIRERVAKVTSDGSTDLLQPLNQAFEALAAAPGGGGNVIFMTDGMDTTGNSPEEILAPCRTVAGKVTVNTVAFGGDADRALLEQIATQTGGQSLEAADAMQLRASYQSALQGASAVVDTSGTVMTNETETLGAAAIGVASAVAGGGGGGDAWTCSGPTTFQASASGPPAGGRALAASLNWDAGELGLDIIDPSGRTVDATYPGAQVRTDASSVLAVIADPREGTWRFAARGVSCPPEGSNYHFTASAIGAKASAADTGGGGGGGFSGGAQPASPSLAVPVVVVVLLVCAGAAAFILTSRPRLGGPGG